MDVHSPEQRSRNMRAIKSSETKMEVLLSKTLWSRGLRFRRNVRSIFGKPDLAIKKYKLAIFVDSEFFHGKDWETNKNRIKSNREFWWPKIESNMHRDLIVTAQLKKEGWTVLRFWSLEVKKNLNKCCVKVERILERKRNGN